MFRTKKLIGTTLIACAFAASATVMAGSPIAPVADAAAATSISGTAVTDGGTRAGGARIDVWRSSDGASWTDVATVTASSTGAYSVGGLSNWFYYKVTAAKIFGACGISSMPIYGGVAQVLWATGGPRGANIRMFFSGSYFNYC